MVASSAQAGAVQSSYAERTAPAAEQAPNNKYEAPQVAY
jgi:hypothetical protein